MAKRIFSIKVAVKRDYGLHSIGFEISEQVEVETTGELRGAYIFLHGLLDDQVKTYEEVSLPHVKLPAGAVPAAAASGTVEDFPLEIIKVESQDGKRRVKACGGKYIKFGVPVYDECKTQIGIETLGYGIHDFRGQNLTVKADIVDGKPRRAVSIS